MKIKQIGVKIKIDEYVYFIVDEGIEEPSWFICLNLHLDHDFHFSCCYKHQRFDNSFSYNKYKGFDTLNEALEELKLYLEKTRGYILDYSEFTKNLD